MTTLIHDIHRAATEYFARQPIDPECPPMAREIISRLKELGDRVSRVNTELGVDGLLTASFRFRQAVSLELDSGDRPPYAVEDQMFERIETAGRVLITKLETGFRLKYGGLLW
jgi:hypothetical protein